MGAIASGRASTYKGLPRGLSQGWRVKSGKTICYLCHLEKAKVFAFTVELHDRVQMVMFIAPAGIVRLKPS